MAAKISLKDLEKNVFQKSFQDGLLDIQIGIMMLTFVLVLYLGPYLGDFWASTIYLPVYAGIFYGFRILRKKIIQPRIGVVEYGKHRKTRLKKITLVMLIINILALILGVVAFFYFSTLPGWFISTQLSIIILVGFSLVGYMLEFPRLYMYGILTATAPIIGELLYTRLGVPHHGFPVTFGVAGGLMILCGIIILLRLLKKYPSSSGEGLE
ncbi:MAG: hypothetical protein WBB69_00785 [Anaerolineales bacterium]